MLDLAGIPIVDVHCHPFVNPGPLSADELVNQLAFAGAGPDFLEAAGIDASKSLAEVTTHRRQTLFVYEAVRELARLLDCPAHLEAVAAARNDAIADYPRYLRRLFEGAGISTLVTDFGYPQPPIDRARFEAEVPAAVVPVFRIEPLIASLLAGDSGWSEFRAAYDEGIAGAFGAGYRGLKSIIAYRTGLAVSAEHLDEAAGRSGLDRIRRGDPQGMKPLRDHLLGRAMRHCIDRDAPMQIHTGVGDFEVNLANCRPSLLMDILREPTLRACKVILVHDGYPYQGEAGYMAQMLPRVYCDLSEGVPFSAHGSPRIIRETLEMAPISKVLYGSDAFSLPEQNYVGAVMGRRALAAVLQEFIGAGTLNETSAMNAARRILGENALEVYGVERR